MSRKFQEWFVFVSAVTLFVAGVFILMGSASRFHVLDEPDALLNVSGRKVLLTAGIGLLAASAFLLMGRNKFVKLVVIAWLSVAFLVYQVGISSGRGVNFFACLGNLGVGWDVHPKTLNVIQFTVFSLLLAGSIGLLLMDRLTQLKKTRLNSAGRDAAAKAAGVTSTS